MSRYIDADKLKENLIAEKKSAYANELYSVSSGLGIAITISNDAPTADVVDRGQYNELYEENLKLREELNNLAGEELPWAIVTVCSRNKGESPYRYHCPHCGYSHKKPSHYCSNCGRRCKE